MSFGMKKGKHTEEQIIGVLKQVEASTPLAVPN